MRGLGSWIVLDCVVEAQHYFFEHLHWRVIVILFELGSHSAQIHGLLDYCQVVRNVHGDRVDGFQEWNRGFLSH
jgi:hypothetical protein